MQRDYFAELYVAGILADMKWNVYFPKRDVGFDFIITKQIGETMFVRPVQVKGKYATVAKTDKPIYGYSGRLTALHADMVLAIPFFSEERIPLCVAYLSRKAIKQNQNKKNYYSYPCTFVNRCARPRPYYRRFFDEDGLKLLERVDFSTQTAEAES